MSETGTSNRPRKAVNYAAMDSLDISDDDEFSGFSSPGSRPPHHKPSKDSSKKEKSKLQKKRKLSKQRHEADSKAPPTSEAEDSDGALTRSAPRPRPALHEKLFLRDLDAALELSRLCTGVAAPEENKKNLPEVSSPSRPPKSPPSAGITPVTVPVEIHGPKTPPAHPSPVCRRGNTDVRILPEPAPQKGDTIDQIVLENSLPGSDATGAEGETLNVLIKQSKVDSASLVNGSKKHVKRKACVIESEDDDFDTVTHSNGVSSTLVGETKIIIRSGPEKVSPLLLSKPKTSEYGATDTSPKVRKATRSVDDSSSDCAMKGRQLATLRPGADLPTNGRGKRTRRAVSFLPEPDSESEDEWAEPDELDEDDLSVSEGSDFEPSPKKKNKKNAPLNENKNSATKTQTNNIASRDTLKRPTVTPTNFNPSCVSSDALAPKSAVISPMTRTGNTETSTSNLSKNARPVSLTNKATAPSATSFATQTKAQSLLIGDNRASSSSPVTFPALARSGSTSVLPRAGQARAAFKCPAMNGAINGASPAARGHESSIPSGILRLGLSRKATFKPLHPNATVN